ncbi:MAG: tRNA (N6-isopentenyl adenosine(37)-C2)-methylthiotransferase MiaB [Pseudomonadota bacterium]
MVETSAVKKLFMVTFGCQMNEYDADRIVRLLAFHGYSLTREPQEADLILLNTCSIREKAEHKVYSLLGRLRPLKKARPDLIIGVCGCVAQQEGEKLLRQVRHLDLVVGTHGLHRLPELLAGIDRTRRPVCYTSFDYDLSPLPALEPARTQVKAYLTIMQGCDNYCSYCVVPYVRGREISREPSQILAEARHLLEHGVKEITLLGQNVNSYGRGLNSKVTFVDLLEKAAALPGLARLRFTTSHPKDLSPELIRAFGKIEPLCEHIHLPVQSGSDRILKAMRRGYTRVEYLKKVEALRESCPEMTITTDFIVGFPGETEKDFQDTLELMDQVRFDGVFSFKYSDRPGTSASRRSNKLDEETKARRLAELQQRQKSITLESNRALLGRWVEVLVEGSSKRQADELTGRTRGNKVVNFAGNGLTPGRRIQSLITQAWSNSLRGTLNR